MKIWIYLEGVQNGPYDIEQITRLPVSGSTPLWHEGMSDWMEAAKAPATAKYFPEGVKSPRAVEPSAPSDMSQAPSIAEVPEAPGETIFAIVDSDDKKDTTPEVEMPDVKEEDKKEDGNESDNLARVIEGQPEREVYDEVGKAVAEEIESIENKPAGMPEPPVEFPPVPEETVSHPDEEAPREVQQQETINPDIPEKEENTGAQEEKYETSDEEYAEENFRKEQLENKRIKKAYPAYLPWSIVLTVCCCTPVSIAAIITGALTLRQRKRKNYPAARKLSNATAWLVIIAITLGIMSVPFNILRLLCTLGGA